VNSRSDHCHDDSTINIVVDYYYYYYYYCLRCVDAVMTEAALTSEPVVLEQLEIVEAVLEPTIVDATEVVVVNNQLLTSEPASEL